MCFIMDKNEVIILSSDEESDSIKIPFKPTKKEIFKSSSQTEKSLDNSKKVSLRNLHLHYVQKNDPNECIDIVDSTENSVGNNLFQSKKPIENSQNHSKPNIVDVDEPLSSKKIFGTQQKTHKHLESMTGNIDTGTEIVVKVRANHPNSETETKELENKISMVKEESNQNLKFFTEFVEFCGSLEEVESDRAKLTKKMMKHYGEADSHYIKSEEFRSLILEFKNKVTKHNLYIIAKEITNELIYRKKSNTHKMEKTSQRDQQAVENVEKINETKRKEKKKTRIINKIIKKLDKLGLKIKELEEKEVDLSDEEDSVYVQLQRYRERFYQIYTKLSKFTTELSDINRIYNQRICFTESKYPEINKCIENWLNKTKRFPDFSDIMKLLETQSSALNLPSNREAIRAIAIEIFQQVGTMLQRKRKYDLWDSLCGYLNDEEDPASKDTLLDEALKKNYDVRVKKEQEIFQHYAELQEKQRLEPEEVPDEEANRSPIESGNEDEEEIERMENLMNRRLDDAIKEDTEGNGEIVGKNDSDQGKQTGLENEVMDETSKAENTQSKESKNNYKNCKSLKWRSGDGRKAKSDNANGNSDDSNTELEKEKENTPNKRDFEEGVEESKWGNGTEDDLDLELIAVKNVNLDKSMSEFYSKIKADTKTVFESPVKRTRNFDNEDLVSWKKMRITCEKDDFEVFEIDDENENPGKKINEVVDVHYCQIFTDNVLDELDQRKKDWGKRKVFRDLTNLNRLMELHGKRRKISGLFTSSYFHRHFYEFEKSSWKRKFKVSFRSLGSRVQKCALNQEEKSRKTVNSDSGGDSDEKDIHNNSEGGAYDEGNNFFSGHGNGSEGDNNEDENKKNGRTDIELNETQREEEEEEEEDENNTEPTEHSPAKEKPEEQLENKAPSELPEKSGEEEEIIQRPDKTSETPNDEGKENKEDISLDVESKEIVPEVTRENESAEPESEEKAEDNVTINEESVEAKESKQEEEVLEAENKSSEVTVEDKSSEEADVIAVSNPNQNSEAENENKLMLPKEVHKYEHIRVNSSAKVIETSMKTRASALPKEYENVRAETTKHPFAGNKPATSWKSTPIDSSPQKLRKRNSSSTSDEEIVKRFLLHSPSSISITPPRKLTLSKSPSQAALQALATLRNLKGISATIVRGKPKEDGIGSSYSRRPDQNSQNLPKRARSDFPIISNVQTVTPKIVNVSGNVSGFDNSWPGISNTSCDSSPIRISNVWGSLPNNFMPSMVNETVTPGCSSQKSSSSPSNAVKKKNTKKTVEYVVLD